MGITNKIGGFLENVHTYNTIKTYYIIFIMLYSEKEVLPFSHILELLRWDRYPINRSVFVNLMECLSV